MKIISRTVLTATIVALAASTVQATPIADWKKLFGTPNPTITGNQTNSPQFGDGTADQMDGVGIAGLFGAFNAPAPVTLAVGETLTVTAGVTLTGGVPGSNSAYRFAIQNDGGQFTSGVSDNWAGGWMHTLGLDSGANSTLYRTTTSGNYMSTTGATNLSAGNVTSGTFSGDSATPYTWTMSITRDSATTVDIVSSFIGGPSSFSQTMTANDVTAGTFTYTAVGIQTTGVSDLDQLTLSNVQFAVVPEPSTGIALLGGVGLVAWLCRRRATGTIVNDEADASRFRQRSAASTPEAQTPGKGG